MFCKKFIRLISSLVLIIMFASSAECMIAQETTQLEVKIKAVAEWLNTVDMKLNQLKMLAQLPQSVINEINGMKELLSENFSQVRSILQDVESITHFTDDIENMLKIRHPDWQAGLKIDDLKERNQKRDKQLKQTFEAYLKSINITAKISITTSKHSTNVCHFYINQAEAVYTAKTACPTLSKTSCPILVLFVQNYRQYPGFQSL